MTDACVYLMQNYDDGGFVNMGSGSEISISDLANMVKEIVGFQGKIIFDTSKPDGTPRKIMDVSRLNSLGWENSIALKQGIEKVYKENFL
jgi:GDP-L-fucose synthase